MATKTKQLKFTAEQMQLFEDNANNGNVDAQVKLGVIYSNGLYKKPDLKKSYEWLELAANAGNVIAQSHLAQLFYTKKALLTTMKRVSIGHKLLLIKVIVMLNRFWGKCMPKENMSVEASIRPLVIGKRPLIKGVLLQC